MKRILILVLLTSTTLCAWSQQEILVSQYMFNGLFINPAYAGSHKFWEATALHRSQWVNLEGAPVSQMLEIDGPLADEKIGLGLVVTHDDIGDTEQFDISANGSYHLDLDAERKNRLSFGIKVGVANYSFRFDETTVFDEGDRVFEDRIVNEYVPKLGAGAYFYNERMFVGLSVPTLLASDDALQLDPTQTSNGTDDVYYEGHLFLNAGYVFDAGENVKVKPSTLVKYHPSAPVQVDINTHVLLYEKLWLGATYRTSQAVIGMVEFNITPQIRAGYAYDLTFNDLADYSSGSHEVMLGYNFGKEVIKMKSPRYF